MRLVKVAIPLLISVGLLNASVAFDSFPGNSFDNSVSISLGDIAALPFTSATTGLLDSLSFAVRTSQAASQPNPLNAFLYADASGQPGTLLEEIQLADIGPFVLAGTVATFNSVTHPLLQTGQNYWVGLQNQDTANHPVIWFWTPSASIPLDIFFGGSWVAETPQPTHAYSARVLTSATPEPATLGLTALGLLGVAGWRKSRSSVAPALPSA
jgi:PEP-CTERM motif